MDLFAEYYRYMDSRDRVEIVASHIYEAVRPFNPGDIFMMIEEEMGFKKLLHIWTRNWPDLGTVIDISNMDMISHPDDVVYEIAQRAAEHFRNIPYIEPDPSFGLGEN